MTQTESTQVVVKVAGVSLRRRTETGPRGGTTHIYQSVDADPDWGYWYQTATQAIGHSNSCDRVTAR